MFNSEEEFLYNSGSTNVLGVVVQKVTGKSLLEYGNEVLFDPPDISGGSWERLSGAGYFFASGGQVYPCCFAAGWGGQYMFIFP